MKCPCNTECRDCVPGFQKIIDLNNAGLVIYRHTTETKDVNKRTGNVEHAVNTTDDVYILHNTKNTDISPADYWPEIDHNRISCPRCRNLIEHAQNLLKKGPTISANDVTGVCDHCKMKDKPCFECQQVVKRFIPGKLNHTDIKKERVKHCLTKIGYLLQNINKITDGEKKRSHSDTHIDQICHDRQRSERKPDVEKLFEPLELDLAINRPHVDTQIDAQIKFKKPVMHFSQLEKLETPIVFKDRFKSDEPSTSTLVKDDKVLGTSKNLDFRRILKPEVILPSKYIAPRVGIDSSETVAKNESIVSFENIFLGTKSGKVFQQGAKINVPQSDEIISFTPTETKHSKNIFTSDKSLERSKQRAKSVEPQTRKENLLARKTIESERTELLRKYHSSETLAIKIHGITEHNLKQANRIIFPRQRSNKETKQKSSSELLKDTKDKLIKAEEEKNLKYLLSKQTDKKSINFDEKETAKKISEKAINQQEFAVDDDQKVGKELKPSEKDADQKTRKDIVKSSKDTDITEEKAQKLERDRQKYSQDSRAAEKGDYKFEKGVQKATSDAPNAPKDDLTSEKVVKKTTEDILQPKKDQTEKSAMKSTKITKNADKDGYKSERGEKKFTKDVGVAEKKAHKFGISTQKTPKAGKDDYISEKSGKKSTKDAQITKKDDYPLEKGGKKSTKDARTAEKYAYKLEKGAQKTSKDVQKIEKDAFTPAKGGKRSIQNAQNTEKDGYTSEKGAKKYTKDAHISKNNADKLALKSIKDSQKDEKIDQKAELRGRKVTKDPFKSPRDARDAQIDITQKSPKNAQKLKKEVQDNEINIKTMSVLPDDLEFEKQIAMKVKQKSQPIEKKNKSELPSSDLKKMKDQELKSKTETKKVDISQFEDGKKNDKRLVKPNARDLIDVKAIKLMRTSFAADDLILKLVEIKQSTWVGDRVRTTDMEPIIDMRISATDSIVRKHQIMMRPQSETCLMWSDDSEFNDEEIKEPAISDVIIGPEIFKIRTPKIQDDESEVPFFLKSGYDASQISKKQEIAKSPKTNEIIKPTKTKESKPPVTEKQETADSTRTPRNNEGIKPTPLLSPGTMSAGTTAKGFVRYTLSDRQFIDNGWTLLPTEKVVRKMNVYRMRPARPEFDWFEHNKNKGLMTYDTGEKLAEFDDNGRGRWFYRNGRMALDYYDAEELNAGQRFVIYSNGEPDERGRSRPYTLLATFDFSGNGIVFDHRGKIRLKYNQTEGVLLDRSIGPVSHWKWHTLNDPPVLQQVMIDTQIAHKDPKIMKMGGPNDNKPRMDNEDMLAIEFDNFIKEKSKKLSQTFKPFQIKMKALKINEHFSLRVLDQATVYLLYRDGTTNLKLNIGMVLDQKEIVDTDTAEVGEVSSSMEKLPARTESLAGLQKSVAHAQHYDRKRTERERKMHPAEPSASVDKMVAGISHPLRPLPRPMLSQSASFTTTEHCKCSRKPTSTNVYYDTRFY